MSDKVKINFEVNPRALLGKVSTQELLKELSRRNKRDFLSDGKVKSAEDEFEDPRDQIEGS